MEVLLPSSEFRSVAAPMAKDDTNAQITKNATTEFTVTWMQGDILDTVTYSRVSGYGLTSPSTQYRSFQRRVFPVNHLHWY